MTSFAYGALWLFIFSIPWERIIVLPGVSIVSRAAGALALGLALLSTVVTARVRRWHIFHVLGLLFLAWAGVALLALHIQGVPAKYWTYVQLFLVLLMVWEIAPKPERLRGLLVAYLCGSYVAALGTIFVFRREMHQLNRFSAGGADPNDLAMTLALAMPVAWYLAMTYQKPLLRWICRGFLPIGLVAIGLTGSRGGMLATMVGLTIIPLTMTKLSPGRMAAAVVVVGLSGALAAAFVPQSLVDRFASTGHEVEDMRLGGRFKLWVAGVHVFATRPLLGVGTSGYKNAITPELGDAAQVAHNSYLSVLVEEGIPGFLIFMLMFSAVFFSLLRLPLLERRFTLVLMATLMIAMAPLTWEDQKVVWFVLAVLLGLAQSMAIPRRVVMVQPVPASRGRLPARPVRPTARPVFPSGRVPRRDA